MTFQNSGRIERRTALPSLREPGPTVLDPLSVYGDFSQHGKTPLGPDLDLLVSV